MYAVGVAPEDEFGTIQPHFQRVGRVASALAPVVEVFPRGFAPRTPYSSRSCSRHLEPVQFLFDLVEGIVADFIVGAHGVHRLPRRMERFAMQV